MLDPKFFIPLEIQEGQINFSDLTSIGLLSVIKLFLINFIIPFGFIFYNVFKNNLKNKPLIFITIIYLTAFLFGTPIHHMAVKFIILPLIILSFNLNSDYIIKKN